VKLTNRGKTEFGLSVKAKLSATEVHEVKEGKDVDDLRCKRLFMVCRRCLELSDDKESILE